MSAVAGSATNTFTGSASSTVGTNIVSVIAQDYSTNISTNLYQVVVSNLVNRALLYDSNGNLTNDSTRSYTWDSANRLVSIAQGTNTVSFTYDGLGRRVGFVENGATRKFLWCGTEICEQRDSSGATVTKQFFPQGVRDSSTNYFYNRDHLGSIREVMASDGTTIAARYDYDPYGRRTKVSGSYDADFGYTGHFHEQPSWMTTGLNLAMFRAYDPELGRWLSRDPIGEPTMMLLPNAYNDPLLSARLGAASIAGSMPNAELLPGGPNIYSYVSNQPINRVDPHGLFGAVPCYFMAKRAAERKYPGNDKKAHCYASCYFARCTLGAIPLTLAGGLAWELMGHALGHPLSVGDLKANLYGTANSPNLGKSCQTICEECPVKSD